MSAIVNIKKGERIQVRKLYAECMKKLKRVLAVLLIITLVLGQSIPNVYASSEISKEDSSFLVNNVAEDIDESIAVTVNFHTNGGSLTMSDKTVTYGDRYGTLPTPIKEGYTFNGWYSSNNGGNHITETSIVEQQESHTIYARWNPIRVMVYFNGNGGYLERTSKEVSFGETYGDLPVPTNGDYKFKGWYTSISGGELVSDESIVNITSSTMLYARWEGDAVNITFDPNGGSISVTSKSVKYGESYGELPIPMKEGYEFTGWYLSGDENTINSSSMVKYKTDHTLIAKWSQIYYSVGFYTDGGEVDENFKFIHTGDEYGTLPTPVKKGYIFLGWYTSDNSDARQVVSSDLFTEAKSITLYARWKAMEHIVYLKGNGANLPTDSIQVAYSGTYEDLPTPVMEHYTFDGWYTHPTSGTRITPNSVVKTNAEEVLYAHWTGNPQNVYFDANGGNTSTEVKEVYYGRNYGSLPNPSRTGYTFDGWYTSLGGGEKITSDHTVRIIAPLTLYAHWTVKQPTITFDGNGGYVIANGEKDDEYSFPLAYGSAYGTLPEAVREGYTFEGWYTSKTGGSEVYSTTINTSTTSDAIYAHWINNIYTVHFNANGGTVYTSSLDYTYGENYGYLPIPEKVNYTFSGWYTAEEGGNKISESSTVKIVDTQTLYAHWTGTRSRVTFDANGGSTSTSGTYVYYNDTYGTLPTPSRTGYSFIGWFTEPMGGVQITDNNVVKITTDQTLYAQWKIKTLVVTLDLNGAKGEKINKTVSYGDTYGALPTPTRPGYTFTGWYTTATGTALVTSDKTVTTNSNHTIYAHWEGDSFYIYFDPTGGTVTETSKWVTNGKLYGTLKTPTRSGYNFGGWYTKVSGGIKATSSTRVDLSGSSTLYAHWTKEVYNVSFNANGGTVEPTSTTVLKGTTFSDFPIPEREGYTFTGWYSASGASGTLITYVTAADTLYAHWAGNPTEIYFDGNGGTPTQYSKSVIYGNQYGELPTASKPYHTFSGWYTEPEGGYVRKETSVVNFSEPVTLYAHYKGISSKVSYDSNGGSNITSTKTVYCGSPYGTLSTPTRAGHSFDGWYTSPYGGNLITSDSIVEATYDHTLYAHWTVYTPTITFNANGGRVIENGYKVPSMKVIKTYGEYYGTLPIAIRTGYTFDGWSTSSTGNTRINESTIVNVTTSDTLYARWIGNTYTINYNANGGTVDKNTTYVIYGNEYGILPTPVRNGYTFTGWYTDVAGGVKITSSTIVDILGTQTLYARWEEKTVSVTYDGNGGTILIENETYSSTTRSLHYNGTYGNTSGLLPAFSRTGYLFVGWFTDIEGGNEITLNTNVEITENHRLYAHWIPKGIPVFFDENGGNPIGTTKEVYYKGTYGTLPTPTRAHYRFLGWFRSKTGNSQVDASTSVASTSEVTLYAHWEPEILTVTLDPNGGDQVTGSLISLYEGTYGTLPTPTRLNHYFKGWYTERVGGYKIENNNIISIPNNHVLYAQWDENYFGISLISNGYVQSSKTVKNNEPYGEFPTPVFAGHHFNGWYTQESGGNLVSATDIVNISGYQTLYAQWTPKTPTVIFYANGGNLEQATKRVTYGSTYGELPIPTLAHYTFDGWYTSLNGTTQITSSTVNTLSDTQMLYAHWTPETYVVSFDGNGGTVSESNKIVKYETTYGTLPTPINSGYNFLGWYMLPTGGSMVDADTLVTIGENHTLYAHWADQNLTVTFDANGGVVNPGTKTFVYGDVYGELPIPTLEYWTFNGWYTAPEGGIQVIGTDTVEVGDSSILYAHWILKGKISETEEELLADYYDEYLEKRILPELLSQGWDIGGIEEISLEDDYDGDGLTLDQEYRNNTDPFIADTDGDRMNDYQEIMVYGTNPMINDTDGDGMSDQSEVSLGLNPLVMDTDGDGILDSAEIITQTVDLEVTEEIDINQTLVKPSVEITGPGDYYNRIYAEEIRDNLIIDELGCVVGSAFEFLHDDNLTFEKSTLSFQISDAITQEIPIEDLAIAYYDFDSQVLELLDTTYTVSAQTVSGGAISSRVLYEAVNTVSGSAITEGVITFEELSAVSVSGGSIRATVVTGGAISYIISAEVDHYSTYMVVNRQLVNSTGNNYRMAAAIQSTGTFLIRLSNGLYVRVMKDPALGDRSIDSDGDGICDLDELGFRYLARLSQDSSQTVETWTFHTNPASQDTDKDGVKDNRDNWDNTKLYVYLKNHAYKPYNMMSRGDNYFVDVNFNKYPYCVIDTKGEYVVQAEKWLLNLGLIGKVNGIYEKQDAIAVAYLQKKYNIGANGIIDNKTYGLLWALDDINKHKNDVKLGIRTQAELDAYNASIMYQSTQARYQNPDYTQDYFTIYYDIMLKHLLVGTESYVTILSMFPGAELYDVSKFLYDLSEYKKGDEAKIVADLVALGIDVAAEFADEIIDAAKMAKKVASKKVAEAIQRTGLSGEKFFEILNTPKGLRPDPSTYLKADYISSHLARFEGGVTKISATAPAGVVGPPGGTFVMPKSLADELIAKTGGNVSKLEELLSLEPGTLGANPVRIDISSPNGLRMPSGNELGANSQWLPGGYTGGGIPEATIDPAKIGTYTVKTIFN